MTNFEQKIQLTVLPLSSQMLTEKRAADERGESHFIVNNQPFCRVAALSLLQGKGSRGNHFHCRKTEGFYLLMGRMQLDLHCLENTRSASFTLEPGSRFFIPPMLAHRMTALEDLWFIEFTDQPYEQSDDNSFTFA